MGRHKLSPSGVWRVLRRHGPNTHRKRLSLVAGYAAPPEPVPREPEPERHLEAKQPVRLCNSSASTSGRYPGGNDNPFWERRDDRFGPTPPWS